MNEQEDDRKSLEEEIEILRSGLDAFYDDLDDMRRAYEAQRARMQDICRAYEAQCTHSARLRERILELAKEAEARAVTFDTAALKPTTCDAERRIASTEFMAAGVLHDPAQALRGLLTPAPSGPGAEAQKEKP